MKIQKHNEPWPHIIIDDLINEDDITTLQDNWETLFNNLGSSRRGRLTYKWNNLPSLNTLEGRIINTAKTIWDKHYKELCGDNDESDLVDNIIYEWLTTTPNDTKRTGIHTDSGMKLMSIVFYVSENGKGTTLYKFNQELDRLEVHHTIDWKPNRALVFVRKKSKVGGTWHNIVNDTPYNRRTLNLSICSYKPVTSQPTHIEY